MNRIERLLQHIQAHPGYGPLRARAADSAETDVLELAKRNMLILGESGALPFLLAFDPPIVHLGEATPGSRPVSVGSGVCLFCFRDRSFRNRAHLFPEALGNKRAFTSDECDDCNKHFGRVVDEHLASMCLPDRVMAGTRGKGGYPKASLGRGRSFAKRTDDVVEFVVADGDDSLEILQSKGATRFTFPAFVHQKMRAARAIVRSALLALSGDGRAVPATALDWLTHDSRDEATLVECLYGGTPFLPPAIAVWPRAAEAPADTPDFVAMLQTGNRLEIIASDGRATFLLPPIPRPVAVDGVGDVDVRARLIRRNVVSRDRDSRTIIVTRRLFGGIDGAPAQPVRVAVQVRGARDAPAQRLAASFVAQDNLPERRYDVVATDTSWSIQLTSSDDETWTLRTQTTPECDDATRGLLDALHHDGSVQIVRTDGVQVFPPAVGAWAGPFRGSETGSARDEIEVRVGDGHP